MQLKSILLVACALAYIGPAFAADESISNSGFTFFPADVTISPGDTVTWIDLQPTHNVAESDSAAANSYNGSGFRSGDVNDVDTFQQTFNTPGVYYFLCEPHAGLGMKGSVTVSVAAPASRHGGIAVAAGLLLLAGLAALRNHTRASD